MVQYSFFLVADKDFTRILDCSFKEGFYFLSSFYTTLIYFTVNKHFDLSINCLFFYIAAYLNYVGYVERLSSTLLF